MVDVPEVALESHAMETVLVLAGFYDIAVRDVVMAISAFCLARLSAVAPSRAEARAGRMRHAEVG